MCVPSDKNNTTLPLVGRIFARTGLLTVFGSVRYPKGKLCEDWLKHFSDRSLVVFLQECPAPGAKSGEFSENFLQTLFTVNFRLFGNNQIIVGKTDNHA